PPPPTRRSSDLPFRIDSRARTDRRTAASPRADHERPPVWRWSETGRVPERRARRRDTRRKAQAASGATGVAAALRGSSALSSKLPSSRPAFLASRQPHIAILAAVPKRYRRTAHAAWLPVPALDAALAQATGRR